MGKDAQKDLEATKKKFEDQIEALSKLLVERTDKCESWCEGHEAPWHGEAGKSKCTWTTGACVACAECKA
mgnify:CR=1 FL=1